MSDLYTDYLNKIAAQVGITAEDFQAHLSEQLPFMKHLAFQRDGVYQKLANISIENGEGIYFCLIRKAPIPTTDIMFLDDYIGHIVKAIYAEATGQNYIAAYRSNSQFLADEAYFENMLNKYPDAGVIYLVPNKFETIARVCEKMGRPLLVLDYHDDNSSKSFYSISVDSGLAVQEMAEQLIANGHRHIAHISGRLGNPGADERLQGYQSALSNAGIPLNPDYVKQGNWQPNGGEAAATELLQTEPRPTAIMCANDLTAIGAYAAIRKAGLAIPDDISVTGLDDLPIASTCYPPLTTIRQPLTEIGQLASQSMIQILQGEPVAKHQTIQTLQFIERESVANIRL